MMNSMNIAWWVKRWSDIHPDKPAVIYEDQTFTYSGFTSACGNDLLLASRHGY